MVLVSLEDYEREAFKRIPKNALDYYASGAGDELSLKLNRSTFDRYVKVKVMILLDRNRTIITF